MAKQAIREFWVRLRKRDERNGIKLRRYMVFGMRFDVEKGWYRVPEVVLRFNPEWNREETVNVVEYLRQVRNDNEDPKSPLAFDVCTEAEARAMDIAEKKARERKAAEADNPNPVDLVSTEVRRGRTNDTVADETGETSKSTKAKRKPGRPRKGDPVSLVAE